MPRIVAFVRCAILGALLVTASAAAGAQQRDSLSEPHPLYLERNYLFKNLPDDETQEWFEGLLALHIPAYQNLQAAYDQVLRGDWRSHHSLAWYFTMLINLRMTQESSAPVRTPSYMPKLTVTYFNVKRREAVRFPNVARTVRLWAVPFVPYGHYSNGQDGCLFEDQTPVGEDCLDPAVISTPRSVNRRDGSFSSHYMQLGVFYRRITLDRVIGMGTAVPAKSYWSLGGQVRAYQPYYWLGGGMSEELRDVYGPFRARVLWNRVSQHKGSVFGPGQFRLEAWIESIHGAERALDPIRASFEIARTMDKRSGWGLFGRVYRGQDDYNLGFMNDITVFQVGVTYSPETMPAFR